MVRRNRAGQFSWTLLQLQREGQVASPDHWAQWVRLGLSTAGFVAALIYYIKWADSWARKHADAELNLRQFELDLNRASWVVETSLEWKRDGQDKIPDDLLKALTKGLFDSSQTQSESARDLWRLQPLRRWSHEQVEQVLT